MAETTVIDLALLIGITGALLLGAALFAAKLKRLPISTAMLYLAAGAAAGPLMAGRLGWDFTALSAVLMHVTELALLISLFIAGLKLGLPANSGGWRLPVRLATVSMAVTVALVAALSMWLLDLPLGAGVLLGAILAPTDPVLATDVQVQDRRDRDQLRVNLTGEGALNDGSAYPFVMLGLGLLGLHDLGGFGWRWLAIDVLWATLGGVALGAAAGLGVGRLVLHLRRERQMAVGHDEFIALGLIALTYALSLASHTYGFLAVFVAAYAFGRHAETSEPQGNEESREAERRKPAEEQTGGSALTENARGFNEQLERIAELLLVLLVGCLLWTADYTAAMFVLTALLLFVARPLAVWIGLLGAKASPLQRRMTAWFGIRGIGSLFYLSYAIQHGLPEHLADTLTACTLLTVGASIALHGASVTPLMRLYGERRRRIAGGRPD